MVQEILRLLPAELPALIQEQQLQTVVLCSLIVAAGAGLVLWVLGARLSRPLVTLAAVAVGAILGLQLPRWLGWTVGGAAPAIAAALVLGVIAFVLHRAFVGIGLGSVIALWAALATWALLSNGATWVWPGIGPETTIPGYVGELRRNVPPEVERVAPFVAAAGMLSGIALALLWSRLATGLLYSLLGTSLMLTAGLTAVRWNKPEWLQHVPQQRWMQGAAVLAVVLIGTLIQCRLSPRGKTAEKKENSKEKEKEPI